MRASVKLPMETEVPALLTAKQVAGLVQVCPRTVWRLRSKGWMPEPIRVGGAVRWRRNEIDQWIGNGCPKR